VISLLEAMVRPFLRLIDAEDAHRLAIHALRLPPFVPLVADDPRLAVRWTVLPPLTLKAGIGIYHSPPSLQAGEVDATFGNPDLGSRYALQTSLGAEWNIRPDLLLSASTTPPVAP